MDRDLLPLMACPDCDLLLRLPRLAAGAKACCPRCGCVVARRPRHGHDLPLALAVTAAIVFVIANTSPLMDLSAVGRQASTTLLGGAWGMWQQGQPLTGALVFFCAFLAPGLFVSALLAVLLAARRPVLPHWAASLLHLSAQMQPWAMFEVMLLGILVALIKIAELATVDAGIGLYALAVLALMFPALIVSIDMPDLWSRVPLQATAGASGGASV